jgi:hypothetical protein
MRRSVGVVPRVV